MDISTPLVLLTELRRTTVGGPIVRFWQIADMLSPIRSFLKTRVVLESENNEAFGRWRRRSR